MRLPGNPVKLGVYKGGLRGARNIARILSVMPWNREQDPIVVAAISAAGGSTKLARELSKKAPITKVAVRQWRRIPEKWIVEVARHSGFTPHQLRPDIYDRKGRRI